MIITEEHPEDGRFICSNVQLPIAIIFKGITQ
jgi:hypothetical protein